MKYSIQIDIHVCTSKNSVILNVREYVDDRNHEINWILIVIQPIEESRKMKSKYSKRMCVYIP